MLADFLLSEDAHRSVADRLATWYLLMADLPPIAIAASAIHTTDRFLTRLFGRSVFSWRYLVFSTLLAFFVYCSLEDSFRTYGPYQNGKNRP